MYSALHLEHDALRLEVAARRFAGILASSGAIGESMESKSKRNDPGVEGIAGKSVLREIQVQAGENTSVSVVRGRHMSVPMKCNPVQPIQVHCQAMKYCLAM